MRWEFVIRRLYKVHLKSVNKNDRLTYKEKNKEVKRKFKEKQEQVGRIRNRKMSGAFKPWVVGWTSASYTLKQFWIAIKKIHVSTVLPVFSLAPSFSNNLNHLVENKDSWEEGGLILILISAF